MQVLTSFIDRRAVEDAGVWVVLDQPGYESSSHLILDGVLPKVALAGRL